MKRYRTIVADPPWPVNTGPSWGTPRTGPRNPASHALAYPTMRVSEITALPVGDIAEEDAHLYLWTINRYVEKSYAVVRAWGFHPSTLLIWRKARKGTGLGGAYALTTEYLLFARRGKLAPLMRWPESGFHWARSTHSRKPDAMLDMVEQVSPGPYLEMFARRARFGWDYWGDESLGTAELPMEAA